MDNDSATYLKELIEARNAVEHQIELLAGGSPPQATNRELQIGDLVNRLRNTLRELDECIAAESSSDHP